MTVEKTKSELRKAAMVKALRSVVRLKHSLLADAELNAVLPAAEHAFDTALQAGELENKQDLFELMREVVAENG